MTLKKQAGYWYGTTPEDVEAEVLRYSRLSGHQAARFRASTCGCGNRTFRLESDEDAGAARRACVACEAVHWMGDSASYAAQARLERHECVCGADAFELRCGVALYDGSNDVRWSYIGCRCTRCELVGVFADWKCESGDADAFLAKA